MTQISHEIRNNFNLDSIKYHINLIQEYTKDKPKNKETELSSELYIMKNYSDFYNEYPFLVKKICKQDDISMIYNMMEELYNIQNGNDTINNVEKKLGNKLANQYLYPNLQK